MDRPVFVAPHYDDAALSCGGTIAMLAREAAPLIVTVFGGEPAEDLSEFARFQHERWGVSGSSVVTRRRREDANAADALGERVEVLWLPYLDAIYRDQRYGSDETLFGTVLESDAGLAERIAQDLVALRARSFYVPMAVGGHVDHRIVLEAGALLAKAGHDVWAWEDLPYALAMGAVARRVNDGGFRECNLVVIDDDALEHKLLAVACYASQLPTVFREYGDYRQALKRYAESLGGNAPGERLWRVSAESR